MRKREGLVAQLGKNARVRILSLIIMVFFGIFLINLVSATTFTNVVSNCAAENSAAKGSFGSACSVTTGSSLQLDDASLETHTYAKTTYGGVRIQSVNSSIVDCGNVTSVYICYKWWRTNTFTPQDCDVSIDSNGGVSYSLATNTCPATTEPVSISCIDVTSLESWSCDNFFGSTGTRAYAKSELTRVTTGAAGTDTGTWDVLYFNVTYTNNILPVIHNISLSTTLIKGGNSMTIYANTTSNGVNDSNANPLTLYCSNTTQTPTAADNICSATDSTYPYDLTCSYTTKIFDGNETVYCRVYDGIGYSTNVSNATYTTDSTAPTLSIISVAGDSLPAYFDTNNDGVTSVNISGESGMSCRWSSSDVSYSSMASSCTVNGIHAICNFTDVASQGSTTRYISCQDSLANQNNATNNLNVDFTLDYTAPTTSDNSVTSVQIPPYIVTLTESDNVDGDPDTFYCIDTLGTCTPTTLIDNGGTVTFTNLNRGRNYFRYFSTDDAGNNQTTQNKTININRLPNLTNATDNSTTIKGGWRVNVSTVSFDLDSTYSQGISLFVCTTPSATSSGCSVSEYCNSTGTSNLSCDFASEIDSATHNWYAFIYDDLGEAATNNPLSGSYTTDSTAPTITIISPANTTYPTVNVSVEISTSEASVWAGYSLDGVANVIMTNISSTSFTASLTNLDYGLHNITFYANDSFENMGVSAVRYFSIATPIDLTAPTLTIVSPSNASYTNPSGTYVNISADEDLVWAGYTLNGGSLNNLTNASARIWYINLTSLSQETNYNLVVYGNDSSANQGNRTSVFYADSLAPRYSSASAPSVNQSQNVNCSIVWNDSYSISSVIISHNADGGFENQTIAFSGNSGIASYLISGNRLSNPGNYTCIFYATDVAGNMNSTSVNFTVSDVISPTLYVGSPLNITYNIGNISLLVFTSEAANSVWFSLNGTNNITMGNTSATSWNSSLVDKSASFYNITFYANDSSGNIGSSTVYFTITLGEGDIVPPVVTISSIANASYKSSSGVNLNVSVNENVTDVNYSLNGATNVSLTNTSMTDWSVVLSDLVQETTYSLVIYANDTSGNIGASSVTFYFDNQSPRFPSFSATSVNETQNVNCSAYVNDTFNFSSVKISENATTSGVFMNHTIDLFATGYANYTILNVAKGNYSCIVYATDLAGNTNSTYTTFTVSDITAPILTINSPIAQNYSTNSILFSLTTNEAVSFANYSLNGGSNVSLTGSGLSWGRVSTVSDGTYTVTFYAADASGNLGTASVNIVVDTTVLDLVAPTITIWSPLNNTYDLDGSVLLNISTDENLVWAGYNNGSGLFNLSNTSLRNWNATISLPEGIHTIVFYANDTSSNKNQANRTVIVNVDLNNASVNNFACDSSVNDSSSLTCNSSVSDVVGLDYAILSYNFSGSFVNSSAIDLIGTSANINYTFLQGNYTPGNYAVQLYVFDLAGRVNDSANTSVQVLDDTVPSVTNIVYSPSDLDSLDPGVSVIFNASVLEDYALGFVAVYYKNISGSSWENSSMTNTSLTDYNTSVVFDAGNWTFYINATDAQGNMNISQNYTLNVSYDVSQSITTNISLIKSFTYAERSSANELGYIILNTTSDTNLTYNVTIISGSDLLSKFNINHTLNQTENYTAENGTVLYIPLYVNLTGRPSELIPYNISIVSAAGTVIIERNLNIQSASGPYLSISIDTYSSRVTQGEIGVTFSATVTNLGTADAQGVYLNWSLPAGFILASGGLERNLATLPVGVSGANTITINALSNISSNLTIAALASSTNANFVNASKLVIITNPITVTQIVEVPGPSTGGGGGGGSVAGGGGGAAVVYFKTIEVVRGNKTSFTIDFGNNKINKTLTNVVMSLTGFPDKYMQIIPNSFYNVYYGENKSFEVLLTAPTYKSYEEHVLKAVIKGTLISGNSQESYIETQNIRLIIQEISRNDAAVKMQTANDSIGLMKEMGYNTIEMEQLYNQARNKLDVDLHNKESYDISAKVIQVKETAFEARKLIDLLRHILNNPQDINLLTGNVVKSDVTQNTIFYSVQIGEVLDMADAAFNRGDYTTALDRAKRAELLLRLEQKGNILIFFYLYWPQILFGIVVILLIGKIVYSKYSKDKLSSKIKDYNREEESINQLMMDNQSRYYSGKISSSEYHSRANQYYNRLAVLRKSRINLRNKRLKVLAPEEFVKELNGEKKEVEGEIVKIQNLFYKDKKISEKNYKPEFDLLNNRLAEIEDERLVIDLKDGYKVIVPKKLGFFSSLFRKFNEKKEKELKEKIDKLIKSEEFKR